MEEAHDRTGLRSRTQALEGEPDVLLAIAFGSLAQGRAGFESDADVAVLAERSLGLERRMALTRLIAEASGRSVDLLDLRETGVPLLRTILREGGAAMCAYREADTPNAAADAALTSRRRPWGSIVFVGWATVLTVLLGLLFVGVTALTIALWATDPAYVETNPVVDLAFFALGGILVTAGVGSQVRGGHVMVAYVRASRSRVR
jgi:predicted nucleotidyltransferase